MKRNSFHFEGGHILPEAVIGAARGGIPYKPHMTCGVCAAYFGIRLNPDHDRLAGKHESEVLARELDPKSVVEIYLYGPGHVRRNVGSLRDATEDAYQRVMHNPTNPVPTAITSMWPDISIFNEISIPSITFGPPRSSSPDVASHNGKFIYKEHLLQAAKTYALLALDICGPAIKAV